MKNPDDRVEYELWYSSILDIQYDTLYDLGLFQKALNKDALFTPRILTYKCDTCDEEIIRRNCYGDGLYCAYYPKQIDRPDSSRISGISLLEESLRQRCIYNVLSEEKEVN